MTRLLALELSGEIGSIALLIGESIAERQIATPREQTEAVLPHLTGLLADAGIGLADLDAVVFGRGPGSFTGLRVATAVAHGFALAIDLPLVPVSSLAAVAQGVWRRDGVATTVVCTDARMGEVYWAIYDVRDGLAELRDSERLGSPSEIGPAPAGVWAAAGDGYARYGSELAGFTAGATLVQVGAGASARDLMPHAIDALAGGRTVALDAALPTYLRREDAWRR